MSDNIAIQSSVFKIHTIYYLYAGNEKKELKRLVIGVTLVIYELKLKNMVINIENQY